MGKNKTSFKPGKSGNPSGRPPGSSNKYDLSAKQWNDDFFNKDRNQCVEDWKKLTAYQRWIIRTKRWEYQFPKLRSLDVSMEFDQLSESQLDIILNRLREGLESYEQS